MEKLIQSGELKYFTDKPARDPETGLAIDNGVYNEILESQRRMHAKGMAFYYEPGDSHFDPTGMYLCGGESGDGVNGCNQYRPGTHTCLSVAKRIDGDCGSCQFWEVYNQEHSDIDLGEEKFTKQAAFYSEREPGGTGYGCKQCEYGNTARVEDGPRTIYCGIWATRVNPLACCSRNHKLGDILYNINTPLSQDKVYKGI